MAALSLSSPNADGKKSLKVLWKKCYRRKWNLKKSLEKRWNPEGKNLERKNLLKYYVTPTRTSSLPNIPRVCRPHLQVGNPPQAPKVYHVTRDRVILSISKSIRLRNSSRISTWLQRATFFISCRPFCFFFLVVFISFWFYSLLWFLICNW